MRDKRTEISDEVIAGSSASEWFGGRFWEKLPVFWKVQLVGWGAFGIYDFFSRASFWGSIPVAAALTLFLEPLYVATTVPMRALYRRMHFRRDGALKIAGLILGSCSAAALIHLFASEGLHRMLNRIGLEGEGGGRYGVRLVFHFLVFASWSLCYFWFKTAWAEREERMKRMAAVAAAQRAELEMLRFQLNPHFLFNSLNNIHTEVFYRPEVASRMILQLADYLRYTLAQPGKLLVPLSQEIEVVREYLGIEQERFDDRLKISIRHPGGQMKQLVPCFLLQPLAENAVKHGLNSSKPPWELIVEISPQPDRVEIRVSNTGRLAGDWERREGEGTGIENLRRRLALHYPGRHRFDIFQREDLVVVEILLEGEPCQV